MIQILRADSKKDSQDIVALIKICRTEKRTVLNEYTEEEEKKYLDNLGPRDAVFVVRVNNLFAGFSSINQRYRYSERLMHCGEVGTWVMPTFRKQGIGKTLWLKGILPWCRIKGFHHLGFFILSYNKEAISFYESLGFRVCGYHRKMISGDDDTFLDALEMEIWIGDKNDH